MPDIQIWAAEKSFLTNYLNSRAVYVIAKAKATDDPESFFKVESDGDGLDNILKIEDDVAFISIYGYLSNDGPDRWDRMFGWGGVSYKQIIAAADKIDADGRVDTVKILMDTPGGLFKGADNAWKRLMALRKNKRIIAVNEGLVASGGYYLASAAHKIHSTSETNEVGSIGVLVAGTDWTKYDEKQGIKNVVIVSKNAPNKHVDIGTEKGRNILQERVDQAEEFFLDRIHQGRKVAVDYITEHYGQGGLLYSQTPDSDKPDALSVGMIDKIINVSNGTGDNFSVPIANFKQENNMTFAEFLAANPEAKAEMDRQLESKFQSGKDKGKADAVATAERVFTFMKEGSPYLASDPIQKTCIAVLKGEQPESSLTNIISVHDMMDEKLKSQDGQDTTDEAGETAADPNLENEGNSAEGKIGSKESMNAALNEEKKQVIPGARRKTKTA